MEKPHLGNATLNESIRGLEIIIPTKRNWFVILFLGAWLGGWTMGEFFAITTLSKFAVSDLGAANFFLLFWLVGWTVGGFFALKTLIWNLKGKEVIQIGQGQLTIEKKGPSFLNPRHTT